MTETLSIPTVHLNGTSGNALLDQLMTAINALHDAREALAMAAPHGRDYYVQPDTSGFDRAQEEHRARLRQIEGVIHELGTLAEGVSDQIVDRNRK